MRFFHTIEQYICCQGYMTILTEFVDQVGASSTPPTHVFLQAGVGSFSGG